MHPNPGSAIQRANLNPHHSSPARTPPLGYCCSPAHILQHLFPTAQGLLTVEAGPPIFKLPQLPIAPRIKSKLLGPWRGPPNTSSLPSSRCFPSRFLFASQQLHG